VGQLSEEERERVPNKIKVLGVLLYFSVLLREKNQKPFVYHMNYSENSGGS
jgi:hypothetical protein